MVERGRFEIIRLILAVIIFYLVYRLAQEVFSPKGRVRREYPGNPAPSHGEDLVRDPCCGVYIPVSQAERLELQGEMHYFCSGECMEKYRTRG